MLGIDFNVKLFEALVPVPAFLVFVWLCWRGERLGVAAPSSPLAGALFVAVALSWLVFVSLTPRARPALPDRLDERQRVERGLRLQRHRPDHQGTAAAQLLDEPRRRCRSRARAAARPPGTGARRRHQSPAGALRLFQYSSSATATLIGTVLFAALVFGRSRSRRLRRRLRRRPTRRASSGSPGSARRSRCGC